MALHVRVSGVWRRVSEAYVRVAGVWRESQAHRRVSGVWEAIHGVATLSGGTFNRVATNGIRVNSDGTVDEGQNPTYVNQISAATDWLIPNTVQGQGDYEVRCTLNSGGPLNGSAVGSWLALSTSRNWYVSLVTATVQADMTIEIRLGTLVVASNTYIIEATF